jgi:hypothetical protein
MTAALMLFEKAGRSAACVLTKASLPPARHRCSAPYVTSETSVDPSVLRRPGVLPTDLARPRVDTARVLALR